MLAVQSTSHARLAGLTDPVGLQADAPLDESRCDVKPGELLVVYGTSNLAAIDESTLLEVDQQLALALARRGLRAAKLLEVADGVLRSVAENPFDGSRPGSDQASPVKRVLRAGAGSNPRCLDSDFKCRRLARGNSRGNGGIGQCARLRA